MNWASWFVGLLYAFVAGMATGVTFVIVDPKDFNFHDGGSHLLSVCLACGVIGLSAYLKDSRPPILRGDTVKDPSRFIGPGVGILLLTVFSSTVQAADLLEPWTIVRPVQTYTPGVSRLLTKSVICSTKWGRDARAVTQSMKKAVFVRYGLDWNDRAAYEVDHLISRELGGADDVGNLWPEPWHLAISGRDMGAHEKDRAENATHRAVCAGELALEDAQRQIAADWTVLYRKYVGEFPPMR